MSTDQQQGKDVAGQADLGRIIWLAVPLVLLGMALALFLSANPMRKLTGNQPPVEDLSVQRVVLDEDGIELHIVNGGAESVTLAQVMVDDAYWTFDIYPSSTLARLETATVKLPYMWVEGEQHVIRLVTSTGTTFDHSIDVAVRSPRSDSRRWIYLGLLGAFIGIVPIVLGLMWFPFMRGLSESTMDFVLALTVGLLVYLWFDTVVEGLEIAGDVAAVYNATPLLYVAILLSFLGLMLIGRRGGATSDRTSPAGRMWVATVIAIGIGLHNLGEGLLVGASVSSGEAALGSFLIVGFVLHNVTEGIGIAAPITGDRPGLGRFVFFALVAGGPAVIGMWLGAFTYTPFMAVLFFAVGAGAILQVIIEVGMFFRNRAIRAGRSVTGWAGAAGFVAGIVLMYGTALLV